MWIVGVTSPLRNETTLSSMSTLIIQSGCLFGEALCYLVDGSYKDRDDGLSLMACDIEALPATILTLNTVDGVECDDLAFLDDGKGSTSKEGLGELVFCGDLIHVNTLTRY